ncbi:MAG: hypothetical protein ACOC23_07700 [Thermodesulfobacteriota bacterium]
MTVEDIRRILRSGAETVFEGVGVKPIFQKGRANQVQPDPPLGGKKDEKIIRLL